MLYHQGLGPFLWNGKQGWTNHQEQVPVSHLRCGGHQKGILPSPVLVAEDDISCPDDEDFVENYSLCLLKYYFILLDLKDTVRESNGSRLTVLCKLLVPYFKSLPSFNTYGIEMLINVVQNEVFISEAEAHQCLWASTANWKGGAVKKKEIDLLQKNCYKDAKKSIKAMVSNKTDSAIERSSKSCGGEEHTVGNFINRDHHAISHSHKSSATDERNALTDRDHHALSHSHKSSATDERKALTDLCELKPFSTTINCKHDFLSDIMADPLATLNLADFDKLLRKHKVLDAPLVQEEDEA